MIPKAPNWMKTTLLLAAIYNMLWGAWVVLFPQHFFNLVGMDEINHAVVWQGMGMVIGVYGIGYALAAVNPILHWPIVMVGLLGKLFGPLGFLINYLAGNIPFNFFYTLITNDLIWWIPFSLIIWRVYQQYRFKLTW